MQTIFSFAVVVVAAVFFAIATRRAMQEENTGDFWDDRNPSGYHRFVPVIFAGVMLLATLGFSFTVHGIYERRAALDAQYGPLAP